MKEPNAKGDGNPLFLTGGDFEFYCLFTAQKSSEDSQNFNAFPSGDESSV